MEVIWISAAQFWAMKRSAQAHARAYVRSGRVSQQSLYLLRRDDLENAKIKWPDRSSSARGLLGQSSDQ